MIMGIKLQVISQSYPLLAGVNDAHDLIYCEFDMSNDNIYVFFSF